MDRLYYHLININLLNLDLLAYHTYYKYNISSIEPARPPIISNLRLVIGLPLILIVPIWEKSALHFHCVYLIFSLSPFSEIISNIIRKLMNRWNFVFRRYKLICFPKSKLFSNNICSTFGSWRFLSILTLFYSHGW